MAKKLEDKVKNSYCFRQEVRERVLRAVIGKRLKEESRENMAALYLANKFSGPDENDEETIVDFHDDDREIFDTIFGPEGIVEIACIPKEPLSEKLFLFLTAASFGASHVPSLDDSEKEWSEQEKSLFWKFAQMEQEEYLRLYREILAETVKEAADMEPEVSGGMEDTGDDGEDDGGSNE